MIPTPIDAHALRSFDVLAADTRLSRRWSPSAMSWADLVAKLSEPRRFDVDAKRFASMTAEERHSLKDVGGWLAGVSDTGYRKAADVKGVRLVRLDMDGAPVDWAEVLKATISGLTHVAHTTASHRPGKPRVRVVLPLSRAVDAEEYAYVSRKLAERIGLDWWPDHSTFRHNQVAFWPAAASDAEFIHVDNGGRVVDVDAMLGAVADWHDVAAWPFPPSGGHAVKGKAEDPRQRGGWRGAFNRAYSVTEAIEAFIPDIYTPTTTAGRWSFAAGSLRNGLVVYDDGLFAYSHHEISDPAAGKLCDAWDLVRIHKFGHLDTQARERTQPHRMPSVIRMTEFVGDDAATLAAVVAGKAAASAEFDDLDAPGDDAWQSEITFDKQAIPKKTFRNLEILLTSDPRLKDLLRFNRMTDETEIEPVRWEARIGPHHMPAGVVGIQDHHVSALRSHVEGLWAMEWAATATHEAVGLVSRGDTYHPILDLIDDVEWDGQPRLDSWLIDYAGCADSEYIRQVGAKVLIAAVARLRSPGCKWDHMLLLHGVQGSGKSTLCKVLALEDRFFAELRSVDPKIAAEVIHGVWIVEMCELEAFDKAEISVLKAFVTVQNDRFRPAYARTVATRPRTCVVIGTTNEVEVLRDPTGNRRFWPVRTTEIDPVGLREVMLQLYAEADVRFALGESLYLDGDAAGQAAEVQEEHRATDPWEDRIRVYLAEEMPVDWYDRVGEFVPLATATEERVKVCVQELLDECIGLAPSNQHTGSRRRVGTIMRGMAGWSDDPRGMRFGKRYGAQRGWDKPPF